MTWRLLAAILSLSGLIVPVAARADIDTWPEIRKELFGEAAISERGAPFLLFAPGQAADAALVPIDIRFPADIATKVAKLSLIIDHNPMPVAATFVFDDAYRATDIGERILSTRVRVDRYTDIRAVLETTRGELFMISTPVAAAGGCATPAAKDYDASLIGFGKIIIRSSSSEAHGSNWRDGSVMIRHPNFTGMQPDPVTHAITAARFIDRLEVNLGSRPLFSMLGGISISENPNLRFTFGKTLVTERLSVRATDTENATFVGTEAFDTE